MAEEGLQYKGIEALFVLILKKDVWWDEHTMV